MTRRRGFHGVLQSLSVALESLSYVKLNVVVVKGLNDAEILDFVEMTKDRPIYVRFIEFMPFTGLLVLYSYYNSDLHITGNKWDAKKMVPSSDLLQTISERHPDVTRAPDELNDTARTWKIPGYLGGPFSARLGSL
jgi:cyclic pyranopterin phosphate synthase